MTTKLTRNDHLVFHFRVREPKTGEALPRGGATVVFAPELSRFGVSICSDKDAFSRKRGRIIADGRAVSKNSFCPFVCDAPFTMELIRKHAKELGQHEAAFVLGDEAVQSWSGDGSFVLER